MAPGPRESTPRRRPAASGEASVTALRPGGSGDPALADLVRRVADGDQGAWRAVVERYGGLLRSVVRTYRLSDSQAADAVQATWLQLVENADAIREPERLAGWLRTTVRRECLATIRRAGRERPSDPHSLQPAVELPADRADADPEAIVLRRERADLVRAAVQDLPEHSQQLLGLLVASPPLSYQEIGSRLGMPVGSIGPTRARLLARLRTALADADLRDAA
ncbi:RNA polymerase sigma factor [Geodermatophilus sp. SYSU D01176]